METPSLTFENAIKRLEEIVQQLNSGQLSLEDSLSQYEEGVHLIQFCHRILQGAERKIEILQQENADSEPVLKQVEEMFFQTDNTVPGRTGEIVTTSKTRRTSQKTSRGTKEKESPPPESEIGNKNAAGKKTLASQTSSQSPPLFDDLDPDVH